MAEAAKVRVGVRVRPLLPRETAQGLPPVITHPSEKQVLVDDNEAHRFTYDHVFPVYASQRDLYASTAAQMLQPFLEGYNVTILAYGQTGSGKTYTMGSECGTTDKYDDDRRGLIPRFLYDMFINLDADVSHRLEASTTASFLEIYGEDVYDLLSDGHAPGTKRVSLQVLEDKNGVFVSGLSQVPVLGWEAALDVLSQGVLNRTTASTLMNTVSSRSHAVFTINLTQSIKDDADPNGDPQTVTSKLTFVDLAGSERLGRTGAEGQRKREGIQINQGLLALGNVVNALGDDRPEKKSGYVPYRQSKLTRLLQDALGGNSQTLFLACVSPAADSINETVAALHYANRARNIKNKVVKNTDGAKEEMRRLRSMAAALQMELVREHFRLGEGGVSAEAAEGDPEATGGPAGLGLGPNAQAEEILGREDVKAYLKLVQAKVTEASRKPQGHGAPLLFGSGCADTDASVASSGVGPYLSPRNNCMLTTPRRVLGDSRGLAGGLDNDPEEELAVLDQLIEWQRQTGEYGVAAKEEEKKLEETDSQIREKESMLLKVRETLQGYHHMRERFEALVGKMGELEKQKASLIATMNSEAAAAEAAAAAAASAGHGSGSGRSKASSASTEALRERLKGVESQLVSLGVQKKKQERAVMVLQRESKKCDELQAGLAQLKRQKVVLQKRQQEAAKRHREYEQRMSREIQAMRKKNNKDLRHMSKMELEVRRQKAASARKDTQVGRIGDKLKRTEEHLLRLLALRKQQGVVDRARARVGVGARRGGVSAATAASRAAAAAVAMAAAKGGQESGTASARAAAMAAAAAADASEARVAAAKYMLDEMVGSRVEQAALRQTFSAKIRTYDELTSSQVGNIGMLRDYRTQLRELKATAAAAATAATPGSSGKGQSWCASKDSGGAENVDPGSSSSGSNRIGLRQGARGGAGDKHSGGSAHKVSGSMGEDVGDVDTFEGQEAVLDALVQETEKAVDETQQKLELLGGELDDMCRRLGLGDSFQGRSGVEAGEIGLDSPGGGAGGGGGGGSDSKEFKAVEGLTPAEARVLVTALVDDMTASGIGEMLRQGEATKAAAEMMVLRDNNKTMKDEMFRLSQRVSRRMSQMHVDHTRDMVRLSMLDSVEDSAEDGGSCFGGSLSGILAECADDEDVDGDADGVARTPQIAPPPAGDGGAGGSERAPGLGPVAANLFSSPVPTSRVSVRASWGGPRSSPRTGMPPMVPSPISSRDANEASANRRLSGQHMDILMARQRHLESTAESDRKRFEKAVERARVLTQDLQRERAERQRVQARLVAAERGAEGLQAENLRDTVAALEGVWSELGVSQDQRLGLMDRVASGVLREAEDLLGQGRDERVSLTAKVSSLREDLHALWAMLGKSDSDEASAMKTLADKPLRTQADKLSKIVTAARESVSVGVTRRAKLRSAASAAVKVLELGEREIGPHLRVLLRQSRFDLPRALRDDEDMEALSLGDAHENDDYQHSAVSGDYLVGAEALKKFESEVRKLRTMQAETLAEYHEVRDEAREAVLSMDLAAEDAFDLCKKTMKDGWVRLSGDRGALEELDEEALDYACALLCSPGTTHVHVSRSRTQHVKMAWSAVKLAMERRKIAFADAQVLVERAHKELVTASKPPVALEAEAPESLYQTQSPAYEAFIEGLSEDFPPLSRGVLEAYEGELMRLREEALSASAATQRNITQSRATLREAGGIAAEGRASDVSLLSAISAMGGSGGSGVRVSDGGPEEAGGAAVTAEAALHRLRPGHNPGAEEWLDEAGSGVAELWESTIEAIKSLSVDAAMARALDKRVSALEGVRSSDQDICQLAQRMAELQAALEPGRLSKRNKSSTHLLDAEKNRNACQAAYIRSLKRLKEQLRSWREACGCGFDPSLLSDVAREALLDLQRAGRTGAKIEHILPHLDSSSSNTSATASAAAAASGNASLRAASPDLFAKPRLAPHDMSTAIASGAKGSAAAIATASAVTSSATSSGGGGGGSSIVAPTPRGGAAAGAALPAPPAPPLNTPLKTQSVRSTSSSTLGGGSGSPPDAGVGAGGGGGSGGGSGGGGGGGSGGGGGGALAGVEFLGSGGGGGSGALMSIANPTLMSSASKAVGSVQSFRGRGGAFGMLLNKVQTGQTPVRPPGAAMFDGLDGMNGGGGGGGGRAGSAEGTP